MNITIKKIVPLLLPLLICAVNAVSGQPVFPVKVSENGRYIVDRNNNPVFWMGTTQWQIFREYTLDEVRIIIEKTSSNGFVFIQAMLMGVGDGTKPNVYGHKPWINDDPLTPNEEYFKNVDSVIRIARDNNLIFSVTLYHQRYRKCITEKNARAWAKWLAGRYRDVPNIVWSMTPEAKQEFVPVLRELAAGLHEGDGPESVVVSRSGSINFCSRRPNRRKNLEPCSPAQRWQMAHGIFGRQDKLLDQYE